MYGIFLRVIFGAAIILNTKVMVIEIKPYQLKYLIKLKYLSRIGPYLKDIINDLKIFDAWKIQLTIAFNLVSSKYNDGEHVMHSKIYNIEIMSNDKADKVIE